ncbi:uncharacterized protein LOC124295418 [Neodiprion lecontei]|uniref:Uncharacterized protein LOC124295418 n=1 Tax=Neodiprion lecontei TaxID=441921 RepID=A0ABM3GM27_NEOLC|nr:uncharacterized protein LOC124295418 [Neodiprion lecontei]
MENKKYLIGDIKENLVGRKLPTNGEVLSAFLYQHCIHKLTLKKSASGTIKKVEEKWLQAGLPTCKNSHAVQKVLQLFNEWLKLKKSRYRKKSTTQKKKETMLKEKFVKLFDIARLDPKQKLDDTKKLFLESQRSNKRYGFIDTSASNEEIHQVAMDIDVDGINQPTTSSPVQDGSIISRFQSTIGTGTTSGSQQSEMFSDFETPSSQPNPPPKIDIMTPELVSALDRANVTSRNATFILAPAYQSIGIDIETLNLSYSTIRRARLRFRQAIAEHLKEKFKTEDRYTLHWDGKILTDLTGSESVDRIAIILSTSNVNQLLGVPKIFDGTAENHAVAILNTLEDWKVTPYIKAMCFDTPAVNTGILNGTAALIERKLNRKLIWLPCRHHIFEIILKGVFEVFWPTTSGPSVPIFGRFKNWWSKADHLKYQSGMKDEFVANALNTDRLEIINLIDNFLTVTQPRNDYKELLELSLIFLDGLPENEISFKCPGTMHHARWINKAIYSLKIFMFRDQFSLSKREINSLRQICIFIILIYIKVWFTCSLAIEAPNNDLQLLKKLLLCEEIQSSVVQKALKKFSDHLWYMNEELAALALFDNNVSNEIKKKMCEAIINNKESKIIREKRYVAKGIELESFFDKDLSEFVSKNSLMLFEAFDLSYDFLEVDVSLWSNNESYRDNLDFFRRLSVVNDSAERGIALIEDYNNCLTKNEEQLQYLLQVVQEHRRSFPDCNKTTLK